LRRAQNRLAEAETYAKQAIEVKRQRYGDQNYNTAYARTTLATIQWKLGKLTEAEAELRTALRIYRGNFPSEHPYVSSAEYYLAEVLLGQHKLDDATTLARATLERLVNTKDASWRIARTQNTLGEALLLQHKTSDAHDYLEQSYKTLAAESSTDPSTLRIAHDRLARLYTATGEKAKLAQLQSVGLNASAITTDESIKNAKR
jgi:tetratricopeptide (TPR) repeat protein